MSDAQQTPPAQPAPPITVTLPDHPPADALADAWMDKYFALADLRRLWSANPPPGTTLADFDQLMPHMIELMRLYLVVGTVKERKRVADYIKGLSDRALANGAPVRAKALGDIAADLFKSVEASVTGPDAVTLSIQNKTGK
jgi:hypothetical protein